MFHKLMNYGRNILLLFVIFVLTSLATNLISPLWPLYIRSFGASMTELGFVFSLSNAVSAVLQIPSGMISDKYGRRRLHVVGTLLSVFPPLLYVFAKNWFDLIPWVILSGIATGLYLPIRWAIVADDSTAQTRAMAYSWISVAMFVGPTVAPLLGGILADLYGIQMPFLACFTLMSLSFPLSILLRETRRKNSSNDAIVIAKNEYNSSNFLSVVFIFTLINVLQGISVGIFSPITPVFVKDQFSLDLTSVGLLYVVGLGFASLVVQFPGAWLANRYDRKKLLVWIALLSSPFFSLFALSRSIAELFVFMFLSNAIFNASFPAFQDLLMDLTPPTKWGFMHGISLTTYWVGMAIGSTLGGVLWDLFGMFIPYHVAAIAMLLSAIPTLFLKDPRHSKN